MFKPIELGEGKWGVKQYDEEGNSVGMLPGSFDSEAEAQASIDSTPEVAPTEPAAPEAPQEEAPAPETAPVDAAPTPEGEVPQPEAEAQVDPAL